MSRKTENKELIKKLDDYNVSVATELVLRDISISLARICDALERIEEPKMSDAEKIKKITEILIDYELVRISPAMHIERIKEVIIEDSDDGK